MIVGAVKVLLVRVSVVALPTNVSVAAGRVNVFEPAIAFARTVIVPEVEPLNTAPVAPIVGSVRVLLVRVCVPVNVTTTAVSIPIVNVEVVLTFATLVVIPVPPVNVKLSVPRATEAEVEPPAFNDRVVLIVAVLAAVKRPCASTVNVGIAVEDPYEPAVTAVLIRATVEVLPASELVTLIWLAVPVIAPPTVS